MKAVSSATSLINTPPASGDIPDPGRWASLAVVLTGAFLAALDFFIVNVSIPAIRTSLKATFAEVQLIIASYGLTYAVLLISGGRLGDIYGRRKMFVWGVISFTAASLLCGIAPSPTPPAIMGTTMKKNVL